MRLLILNGDLPIFPGRAGHEYLQTTGLARLAQRVGLVSLVHTQEQDEGRHGLLDARVILHLWRSPNLGRESSSAGLTGPTLRRRVAEALYARARNWRRRPVDSLVQDLQFRNISGPLLEALSNEQWQALIVVQSNCARWLDYLPRAPISVLVMHDVRALMYERQAAVANSMWKRRASLREARRYRRFEREYCRRYDLIVTVSSADEAWVRTHYRPRRVTTVPIPVDHAYFAPMPGVREQPGRIVFTGMMAHPPNVDAAEFFARDVLPHVHTRIPDAEFWIVGRDPSPPVQALAGLPGVVVTSFVRDMRPYIAQATVVVVPLRFGSGMRNKILEAWAMEKCVVSTRVGAEGLEAEDAENILLGDDAETLAARVVEAIRDPGLRDRIRSRSRVLVSASHDPGALARQYYDAIGATLREARRSHEAVRTLIDLRWMRPGVAGGIENLSRSFLDHLLRLDGFNHYNVLVPTEVRYDFDVRNRANFTFNAADGPRAYARKAALQLARFLHGHLGIQYWRTPEVEKLSRVRAREAEVALSVPGYIHPELWPLTNVLIVPDIQHEYRPEFFSPHELAERRWLYTDSARRAAHICAISEFTRQTLIERLGIRPDAITTTHLAADPIFHPGSACRGDPNTVLEKYGLKAGQYLLFPGNTWPHKNHRAAFRALQILRAAHGVDPLLVCTGTSKEGHGDLLGVIRDLGLEERVRFVGYCPATDMPALYEGAAALLFPSLFEGFGIPLLEAMWCDCPIVASDATSLPEIAGDAALLVDPRSPEAIAHAVNQVLTADDLRARLIERGRRRARDFSWGKFTREVLRALHEARRMRYGE